MTTLNDLIASIHTSMHSYTGVQEQVTWLTAGVDASVTSMNVASSETVLRGIAEIDEELIYVSSSDSNSLALAPFGRGFRGSVAASHANNAQVTFDPIFPRVEIRRAIDQLVEGLFPQLWQVKTTDIVFNGTKLGYSLPADCVGIIEAKWALTSNVFDLWEPISRFKFDPASPLTNGKALNIFDSIQPGATVRVVYRAKFGTFASGSDTLSSVGLSESYADLILYGVAARMIRFLDPGRLQTLSVENLSRSAVVQSGDASKVANQLYAMYQQRLAEERARLIELTPPQINFTR